MIFAALIEAADAGELVLESGGMCRYHRRRDGVVVIREIIVLPHLRRHGVGRRMVGTVRARNLGAVLRARCPAAYPSNGFWERLGFARAGQANGVNVWEFRT